MRNNNSKLNKIWRIILRYVTPSLTIFSLAFCISYMASAEFMAIDKSNAASTIHTSVTAGDYYLNLTSLGEVNIDLNATTSGNTSTANDTITVNTNTSGYKLYISTDSTNTDSNKMYLNGNSSSGYSVNPVDSTSSPTSLSINSWGYKLNGESDNQYKAVPIKSNETLFATKTGLTAGTDSINNHAITYGVKADLGLPAGNYSTTVSYSAIADASSVSNLASVYPNEVERAGSGTFTLTVTIPMMTNMETGNWTVSITPTTGSSTDETECTNPTATKTNTGINITCIASKSLVKGTYTVVATNTKYGTYTASSALRYTLPPYTGPAVGIYTINNIQNMSSSICDANTTPSAAATLFDTDGTHHGDDDYIPQRTLTDTRDNKEYVIQKMPDGKCWMVQNLAINPGTLSASKTNVSSDYTLPSGSENFTGYNVQATKVGSHTNGSLTSTGNWYSFNAATAGNGSSKTSDGDIIDSGDICPKSWRLPNGGDSGEFQALYSYYNDRTKFDAIWHLVYSGYYNNTTLSNSDSDSFWWSRTSKSDSMAYGLGEYISGYIGTARSNRRNVGMSVRCIAK